MTNLFRKPLRDLVLDTLVGAGWLTWASVSVRAAVKSGGLIDWGRVLFLLLLAILFVMRNAPQKASAARESFIAYVGTLLPVVMLKPVGGGLILLGESLQVLGLAGMFGAAVSLGRGFGIAPADRGLRSAGFYRIVRHPLYATEICFYAGYVIANPTVTNTVALIIVTILQVIRIGWEERTIDKYAGYAQHVRYRLIPFVW